MAVVPTTEITVINKNDIPESIQEHVIDNLKICLIDRETQVMQVVSTKCKLDHLEKDGKTIIEQNIGFFTHQLKITVEEIINKKIQIDKSFSIEHIDKMNVENIQNIPNFKDIFNDNTSCNYEIVDYQGNQYKYHIGIIFITKANEYIHILPIETKIDKNKDKITKLSLIFLYYLKGAILNQKCVNQEKFVEKLKSYFTAKQISIEFKDDIQITEEKISDDILNNPQIEITVDNKADIKKSIETINNILNKSQIEITVDNKADIKKSIETVNKILNDPKIEITVDNKEYIKKSIETINKILNDPKIEITFDNKADIKKSIETINKILNDPKIEITVDNKEDIIQSIETINNILNNSQIEITVDNKEYIKKSIETVNKILNDPKIEITFDKKEDIIQSIAKIQTLLANSKTIIEVNEKNDIVDFVKKQTNLENLVKENIKNIIENIANIITNSNNNPPIKQRLSIQSELANLSKQITNYKPDDIQNVVTYLNEQENENESLLKKINQIFVAAISKQTVIFEKEISESQFKEIYDNTWVKPFFYKGMSIKTKQTDVALKIDEKKGKIVMNKNFKLEYIPP